MTAPLTCLFTGMTSRQSRHSSQTAGHMGDGGDDVAPTVTGDMSVDAGAVPSPTGDGSANGRSAPCLS